ncbi:transposable element Tcb1 transposase [Trichonephila clavipes]|nr:transposable element Tcb1 transposase [Trichonephila clavipes]
MWRVQLMTCSSCCWGMRMPLVLRCKQSLFRIIFSANLLRIGSNEMGLKLSGKVGSLPGFKIGITEAVFQACGKKPTFRIVSIITVRGRLLEIVLRGCKARPKPLLTEFQRKRRLTWAREHSLWTIIDWEKVIFSNESQFCISGNQSSAYVRRCTHEEFSPQCLKPTVKYPTKVMVWGCMSSHGVGRLHIVSGTVKAMDYIEILQNKLLPTARDLFGNQSWIFQDDYASCHRAKVVRNG